MKANNTKDNLFKKEKKEINTEENIKKVLRAVKKEQEKESVWEKYKDDFESL